MSFPIDLDSPGLRPYSPENSKDATDADAKPSSPIAPPLSPTTSTPEQYFETDTSSPLSSETSRESVKNQPSPVLDQSLSSKLEAEYRARANTFVQKLDYYYLNREITFINIMRGLDHTYENMTPAPKPARDLRSAEIENEVIFDHYLRKKRSAQSVPKCQEPQAESAKIEDQGQEYQEPAAKRAKLENTAQQQHHTFDVASEDVPSGYEEHLEELENRVDSLGR
jgi:hypothetical protein